MCVTAWETLDVNANLLTDSVFLAELGHLNLNAVCQSVADHMVTEGTAWEPAL